MPTDVILVCAAVAKVPIRLPPVTLPVVETLPAITLPWLLTTPNTINVLESLLKVILAVASALPLVLNITCVLLPGTTKFPVMLPKKFPTKY